MKVKFVLVMDYVVVEIHGEKFIADQLILEWESEMEKTEVMEIAHQWITSKNFLTQRMVGLSRVGESSLTIEEVKVVANRLGDKGLDVNLGNDIPDVR